MSKITRPRGAIVIVSLMFLLLSAGTSYGQARSDSPPTPAVSEILDKCGKFFSTWQSTQLNSDAELMFFDDKNNEWKMTGYSKSISAWDDTRWYRHYQEINRPVDFQHLLNASFGETVTVGENVLSVSFDGRVPTPEEYDSRDFSLFGEQGTDFSVTFYDGAAGSKRRSEGNPGIQILSGIQKNKNQTGSILDEFRGRQECTIEAATMLDRPCWQISSVGTSGKCLITICPELGYAPLEIRTVRGVDDLHWSGKRIRDMGKTENRMQSAESVQAFEAIKSDWTEFTIRNQSRGSYQDGSSGGIASVARYFDVERPATDAAFQLQTQIKNGTPVVLIDNQQIKAEWHDGKVVRMYDGSAVKELASVEMKPARFGVGRMLSIAAPVAIVVGVGYWSWKRRKKKTNDLGSRTRR